MRHFTAVLLFILTAVATKAFAQSEDVEKISFKELTEFTVTANKRHFKIKGPNRFVYDVANDSSLIEASTLDALKRIPLLDVRNDGTVKANSQNRIIYKLNGLQNPLLEQSVEQTLSGIPSDAVSRIEMRAVQNGNDGEFLEINIITKGKLEGYRAQLSSSLGDASWVNTLWGMSKIRNLNFSGNYSNMWFYGHNVRTRKTDTRSSDSQFHRFESLGTDKGYRADSHNIELAVSYDLDDKSLLSIYGRAILKSDPHTSFQSKTKISGEDGILNTEYDYKDTQEFHDSEYEASVKYEKRYTTRAREGHIFAGYEFYSRPTGTDQKGINTVLSQDLPSSFLDLNDYTLFSDKKYITHTLLGEWERQISNHCGLSFTGKLRNRNEDWSNDVTREYLADNRLERSLSEIRLREYFGNLSPKFCYYGRRWEASAGMSMQFNRHRIHSSDITEKISNTDLRFLPYGYIAFITRRNLLFNLSYAMQSAIPDIQALNPYINRDVAGQISYGNPYLKPQISQNLTFTLSGKTGKLYTSGAINTSYVRNIILENKFVEESILNRTYSNIASRRSIGISGYSAGRVNRDIYLRFNASLDWLQYRAPRLYLKNQGWQFACSAKGEFEIPWGLTLDLSTGYNTRTIMLQGSSSHNITYDIGLFKVFFRNSLSVFVEAASFIPIRFTTKTYVQAPGYTSTTWRNTFHASFRLTLRYTFGKLRSSVKPSSFEIDNSDIRKDYSK